MCRQATGSAFKPFAGIERSKLGIRKGEENLMTFGEENSHDTRCKLCGSFLYSVVRDGNFVHVAMVAWHPHLACIKSTASVEAAQRRTSPNAYLLQPVERVPHHRPSSVFFRKLMSLSGTNSPLASRSWISITRDQ